ncbi:MAG: hypothetical protein ACTH2U_05945 [Brevibacterium sp.]
MAIELVSAGECRAEMASPFFAAGSSDHLGDDIVTRLESARIAMTGFRPQPNGFG